MLALAAALIGFIGNSHTPIPALERTSVKSIALPRVLGGSKAGLGEHYPSPLLHLAFAKSFDSQLDRKEKPRRRRGLELQDSPDSIAFFDLSRRELPPFAKARSREIPNRRLRSFAILLRRDQEAVSNIHGSERILRILRTTMTRIAERNVFIDLQAVTPMLRATKR